MIVDSHQHFWRLGRGDYSWPTPDLVAIHRDFEPDDLWPMLAAAGIDRTILVQATPTVAETEFLLELAAQHAAIAGVVGWVDFDQPDAAATIHRLAQNPLLKGLRPMIQGIADPDWMLRPALAAAFEAMLACGLRFDALILPVHLPRLLTLAERWPDLPIVIDHGAKPAIASGDIAGWRRDIAAVAERTDALCKVSGLLTEAGDDPSLAAITPALDHLLTCFGPERLMWGSDWPVLNLAASYDQWWAMTQHFCAPLDHAARAAVLGGNAARFYGLGPMSTAMEG